MVYRNDNEQLITVGGTDGTIRFWDGISMQLRVTLYAMEAGYLWTTPPAPEEGAPGGWFHTDKQDLI